MSGCRHCGADERASRPASGTWRYDCQGCGAFRYRPLPGEPLLTVLNFSGGKQSSALLWMVLRGEIRAPKHFVVLTADPGMENSDTYEYVRDMQQRCAEAGIGAVTVPGPNLYEDLVTLRTRKTDRLDQPPYWTKSGDGSEGRLQQKCTREYKIRPMDRYVRRLLRERFSLGERSQPPQGCVEKWIGFAYDEQARIKLPSAGYQTFAFPLVERRMDREAVEAYFRDHALPVPPRSVCNACFANGLDHLQRMYRERPDDWQKAVEVDEAVRDLSQIGIRDRVFVSATRVPLRELARRGFDVSDVRKDADAYSCDSGYCFT